MCVDSTGNRRTVRIAAQFFSSESRKSKNVAQRGREAADLGVLKTNYNMHFCSAAKLKGEHRRHEGVQFAHSVTN